MNYYNEHDQNAAAWLRELITLIRVLQVDTSYGPIEHGRLGIESTPFQAICSFWSSAIGHFVHVPACEPHLERGIRRNSRRLWARQGYSAETAQDWSLAIASPLCVGDIRIPFQDCAGETLSQTLLLAPFGRRQSKSISDSDPGGLGMFYRSDGNRAQLQDLACFSNDMQLRISVSRTLPRELVRGDYCKRGII